MAAHQVDVKDVTRRSLIRTRIADQQDTLGLLAQLPSHAFGNSIAVELLLCFTRLTA